MNLHKIDDIEVPRFYNGDLWVVDSQAEMDEPIMLDFEYSGQIHPPTKDIGMPVLGYIKRDFVELACYCAWYPVPLNIDTHMSFNIALQGPADWTWETNGSLRQKEQIADKIICHWEQKKLVNDITIIGMPLRNAFIDPNSVFWGPKEMIGSQKVLDDNAKRMRGALENWLGPRGLEESVRFAITPREEGGAYARSGLIVVGGGYPTEQKYRRQVLQAMCHEMSHDWFCKASIKTYDNWVDEALAEYCSVIITDKELNENFLQWYVDKTRERLEKAGEVPAIRSLTRDLEESYAAFYHRGFLLFNKIAESVGYDEFNDFVAGFAQTCVVNRIITTEMLLQHIEEQFGLVTRKIAETWLDYAGLGTPES